MFGLRYTDVFQPIEEAFESNAAFEAGQGRTRASMRATAEGDVVAQMRTVKIELIRILEMSRIMVYGAERDGHDAPGRNRNTANRG